MACWLLKTEPSSFSWSQLVRARQTVWDGVANALALQHLRVMRQGDEALIYHSGGERALVGIAEAITDPYPDPKLADPRRVVVDVAAVRALPRPVALATIKADRALRELALVRLPRLSVMPVAPAHRDRLLALAGVPE